MFVFSGDVYVSMQIVFLMRKSALIYRRSLRQRVASLTLDGNGVFSIEAAWKLTIMTSVGSYRGNV